jgi:hypothetical protein
MPGAMNYNEFPEKLLENKIRLFTVSIVLCRCYCYCYFSANGGVYCQYSLAIYT